MTEKEILAKLHLASGYWEKFMRQLGLFFLLIMMSVVTYAEDPAEEEILAASTVQIQVPQVYPAKAGDNTAVIMRFLNQSETGHVVIAAYSPIAKQIQLRTVVSVNGHHVPVKIHSFALPIHATTWLGRSQKHFALMHLTQNLMVGEAIPITVIYRDGSYATVQAQAISASSAA